MRVIVVDDDKIVVNSLETILTAMDFEVVGHAYDGKEALDLFNRVHPDVVLMDIRMEDYDGIWATENILKSDKNAKVLLLTTFSEETYIKEGVKKGAKGYILKDNFDELKSAIETVYSGNMVFDPDVYKIAIDIKKGDAPEGLTKREIEILDLIADGKNNKEIGEELFLSEGTVRNHVSNILLKTDSRDRTELAVKYLKGRL